MTKPDPVFVLVLLIAFLSGGFFGYDLGHQAGTREAAAVANLLNAPQVAQSILNWRGR